MTNLGSDNKEELFLKRIIQKATVEPPQEGFTSRVMEKIIREKAPLPESIPFFKKIKVWHLGVVAGFLALIIILFYFYPEKITLIGSNFDPLIIPVFKKLFLGFGELIPKLKVSAFTWTIILAIAGLFIIDRIISRFRTRKNFFILV